jgi:hypothetical protein
VREIDAVLSPPGASIRVVCSAARPDDDPVCRYAVPKSQCERGGRVLVCELPADARAGLAGIR